MSNNINNPYAKKTVTRRNFLLSLAGTGAVGLGGGALLTLLNKSDGITVDQKAKVDVANPLKNSTSPLIMGSDNVTATKEPVVETAQDFSGLTIDPKYKDRILVVIELFGGNDGLSMVPPYGTGKYYDLRGGLAVPQNEVLPINDQFGLHRELVNLHERKDQLAIVQGIGHTDGNLSHFQMQDQVNLGNSGSENYRTGFLARLGNAIGSQDPDAGLLAASTYGYSLGMRNITAPFLSTSDLAQLDVISDKDATYAAYREAVSSFKGDPLSDATGDIFSKIYNPKNVFPSAAESAASELASYDSGDNATGRDLGAQLAIAAHLIRADIGVKIIQTKISGFDNHSGMGFAYPELMKGVDGALGAFLNDIETMGKKDDVLVCIISEFGRRCQVSGDGLDHGNGSMTMAIGPVKPGIYGDDISLNDLDEKGNIKPTVTFGQYQASWAQDWLGVPADLLLDESPETLKFV